jgi:hypothetical protein
MVGRPAKGSEEVAVKIRVSYEGVGDGVVLAMAWRVLVGGPWDAGMKTRTWGLLLKIF